MQPKSDNFNLKSNNNATMELNKTFIDGLWSKEINVTSFVQTNITPYLGDASFLQGPTERTEHI